MSTVFARVSTTSLEMIVVSSVSASKVLWCTMPYILSAVSIKPRESVSERFRKMFPIRKNLRYE